MLNPCSWISYRVTLVGASLLSYADKTVRAVIVQYRLNDVLNRYLGTTNIHEHLSMIDQKLDLIIHEIQQGFGMLAGSPILIHADFEGHAGSLIIQHANEIKNLDIHCAPLYINHSTMHDDVQPTSGSHL
jgi:hypothetical protein